MVWRKASLRARQLGLRTRIILTFLLASLLLSGLLIVIVFTLTRQNLLSGRENDALATAGFNASAVNRRLTDDIESEALQGVVSTLATPEGSRPVLRVGDEWFAQSFEFESEDIHERLLAAVRQNEPSQMRYRVRDKTFLVMGIPLPDWDADYYEATPLDDIDDTLGSLGIVLLSAGGGTTLVSAGVGIWASRRLLRPLDDIGEAAKAISQGDLDTRLEAGAARELVTLTDSFNEMVEALQQRIARDERFASDVSHELRSPLMTITASLEVMNTRRAELPQRSQTALDLLSADVIRFQQLVEDLLEISRYDSGTAALDLDDFDLVEFVKQAVSAAAPLQSIPIVSEPPGTRMRVQADKRRLAQIIDNILGNAQKYASGATLITLRRQGPTVEIAIEDDGPGVPEEERERIFERFSRGRHAGGRGSDTGVGLGLALVSEHVHLHEGEVWCENRPNEQTGARFVLQFPAKAL